MAILVSQPFDASTQNPIDARCKQPSIAAALSALDSTRRTEGMLVWIDDEQQFYHFKGGTANSDFIAFASGGGSGSTDSPMTSSQIDNILSNTGFPVITP